MSFLDNKMAHLFKWPSSFEYQIRFLQTITLPVGVKGVIKYSAEWVNSSFNNQRVIKEINDQKNLNAIFWLFSGKPRIDTSTSRFNFAIPIRLLTITQVKQDKANGDLYIEFIAQEFINSFQKIEREEEVKSIIYFSQTQEDQSMPGMRKGYLHLGNSFNVDSKEKHPDFNRLWDIYKTIPTYEADGIQNFEFPLIWINQIENSKINNSGEFNIFFNKRYEIEFSYKQDDSYYNREISLRQVYSSKENEKKFVGKTKLDKISFFEKDIDNTEMPIEVSFITSIGKISYPLILFEKVSIQWHYWAIPIYIVLWLAIAAFVIYGFNAGIPQQAQICAAIIIFLSGIQTILTTKLLSIT
jgi:hypothetical protein